MASVHSSAIQYKSAEQPRRRSAAPVVSDAALPTMGRKVMLAAVCWLALAKTWADAKKASIKLEDSVGEATVSRLYRNVPVGVYASAAPYAAFSFHVPTFATSPRLTQLGPIKQESVVVENTHGYLKDSYGNKFVGSPQALAYRTPFPQQYLQLQELPAHLAQPLVSAAPNFQYKQATPHFFGPTYNLQTLQASLPSTANRYAINQPQAYSGSIKTLVPNQQQQHPTSNQAIFANTHDAEQFTNLKNVGKSQRLQEIPSDHKVTNEHRALNDYSIVNDHTVTQQNDHIHKEHKEKAAGTAPQVIQKDKLQHAAAATAASSNKGNKAVIKIVTKPPVPLLDLTLLEPLTFDNPLVPQVQHFLPRINSVTYQKLPQLNVNDIKKEMKQFIIQNTKSYDSGIVKGKPKNNLPKRPESKPQIDEEGGHHEQVPPAPTPEDVSNEEPEIVYEINSPNYKETYKEKVVSYNKETQSEPVTYNYEQKSEKEPVHYNYVHSSKEPLQVKNIHYGSDGQNPKQLVYTFTPEDKNEDHYEDNSKQHNKSEKSSHESSEENDPRHQQQLTKDIPHEKKPAHNHYHDRSEHRHHHHNEKPEHHQYHERSQPHNHHQYHHRQHHHENPKHYDNPQHHHSENSQRNHHQHHERPEQHHHQHHERPEHHHHERPEQHHHNNERPEHREGEYHHSSGKVIPQNIHHKSPKEYSQVKKAPAENSNDNFQPIITEYEENIRILPSPQPYAPIKVNPNQHIQHGQAPSQPREPHRQPHDHSHNHPNQHSRPHHNTERNAHDQTKRHKEDAPEPQSNEQLNEEDSEQDEESEEDFEKSYKNAAIGFPAYESRDTEKEIYDPDSYGKPRYHTNFDIEHSPFQQYQVDGDEFPKSTRSNYKDARDKTKEEYYLDYAISKPESLLARYKQKEDYYKMFMKQKPHYLFNEREDDKNQKQSEKYIVAPAFQYHVSTQKPKQYFAQYKAAPVAHVFEYDYSKEAPKDNSAHSSRPHQRFKTHTQFVEPQFQYGFEPSALPRLLDSELAAMASNNSPEMRKKIFKENWYIKKTIMNGRQVDS